MVKPLVKIIEREGNKPKIIEIAGQRYYSIAETARQAKVARYTIVNWYNGGKITGLIQDQYSRQLYVPQNVVKQLRPANRFIKT